MGRVRVGERGLDGKTVPTREGHLRLPKTEVERTTSVVTYLGPLDGRILDLGGGGLENRCGATIIVGQGPDHNQIVR